MSGLPATWGNDVGCPICRALQMQNEGATPVEVAIVAFALGEASDALCCADHDARTTAAVEHLRERRREEARRRNARRHE